MIFYVLPNQLFDIKYIPEDVTTIYIWEHPSFFTKYNFNKKKLVLHRASMKSYYDVKYIEYDEEHILSDRGSLYDPAQHARLSQHPRAGGHRRATQQGALPNQPAVRREKKMSVSG